MASTRGQTANNEEAANPPVTTNPHARVTPTPENPRGYPPFDMNLVPNYTNNQITYYYTNGAVPATELGRFHQLMKQRKTSLDLIGWDGTSNHASDEEINPTRQAVENAPSTQGDSDSDCPRPVPGAKGIKISASDIPQLKYDSTVAQYSNWLADLKTAFDGDPAKFPTSRHKVILASVTLDEQLKTVYNSAATANPILSRHWRKFERWIRDVVLHQGSDKLKLSTEFTTARQKLHEDPNKFYIRLFNLGIQSDRTVTTEDYRTRLLKPLRNLMDQQDREYRTVQDAVTHAARLWQTLDPEKLLQELKEDRERARQRRLGSKDTRNPRSDHSREDQSQRQRDRQSGPRPNRTSQEPRKDESRSRPRLTDEEQQYRLQNHLCFNCGYPGHIKPDCTYPFNPNRVTLKSNDKDKTKSQPTRTSRKRARVQPVRAESVSDQDHNAHTTEDSGSDSETERPVKRSKN
jgi:hypothetical protein